MAAVTSQDGTRIAYDRVGGGDPVILVDGALCYRAQGPSAPLAKRLGERFTVYTYDRRGRGESGDTDPYAVAHEVEDIEALIAAAGGSAHLYGVSSGGALALEAANRLPGVRSLALYEVPFVVDDSRKNAVPADFNEHMSALIDADRRADALRYFLATGVEVPRPFVAMMRFMPAWSKLVAIAHTLRYDLSILGDGFATGDPLPSDRWTTVTAPTVVIEGTKSPNWMRNSQQALAALLGAEHRTLDGQTHMVRHWRRCSASSSPVRARPPTSRPRARSSRSDDPLSCHGPARGQDRYGPGGPPRGHGGPRGGATPGGVGHDRRLHLPDHSRNPRREFKIPLSAENREAADVSAGDEVGVDVEVDTEPREVVLPADFTRALRTEAEAQRFFDGLTPTQRGHYVSWIDREACAAGPRSRPAGSRKEHDLPSRVALAELGVASRTCPRG